MKNRESERGTHFVSHQSLAMAIFSSAMENLFLLRHNRKFFVGDDKFLVGDGKFVVGDASFSLEMTSLSGDMNLALGVRFCRCILPRPSFFLAISSLS